MSTPDTPRPQGPKRLRRSDERWIGGVCGGIAEYTGLDPLLVRLLTVAAVFLGLGSAFLIYLAAWLIVPDARNH